MNFKKTAAILAAAGALTALAIPALADTTLYGSARIGTFFDSKDVVAGTNIDLRNQANSRFGVNFSNENLGGRVELGLGTPGLGTGGNTTVYTRLIYGTYKFDAGTLLVGQTYSPYTLLSEQVALDDNANISYGALYDGRTPQIKFTLNNGLYLAAIRPVAAGATDTIHVIAPKLALGYEGKAGNIGFGAGVVGETYKDNALNKQINSLMGYAHGVMTAGPATFALNLGAGQNIGNMGIAEGGSASWLVAAKAATPATLSIAGAVTPGVAAVAASGPFENSFTFSALGQASYVVSPMLKANVGVGYVNINRTGFALPDNKLAAFVNAPIVLAKGVTIVPEFSYLNQLNDSAKYSGAKDYIYGAKCQLDF